MSILTIQQTVADFLNRCPYLVESHVEAIAEDKGDVAAEIQAKLGKFGICALVSVPSMRPKSTAARAIVCEALFSVEVAETPLMNRGRAGSTTCALAAEYIAGALNLQPLRPEGGGEALLPVFAGLSSISADKQTIVAIVDFMIQTTINPPADTAGIAP